MTDSNAILEPLIVKELRDPDSWTTSIYPGRRTSPIAAKGPPETAILFKTAGNALQAVSRSIAPSDNLKAITVPENMSPGDSLLVLVPGRRDGERETDDENAAENEAGKTRTIQVEIPPNTYPGHVFLVRIPPEETERQQQAPLSPLAVTGEDIGSVRSGESNSTTQVVSGRDIEETELRLRVETATQQEQQQQQPAASTNHQPPKATAIPQPQPRPEEEAAAWAAVAAAAGAAKVSQSLGQQQHQQNLPMAHPLFPPPPPQPDDGSTTSSSTLVLVKVPPGSIPGSKIHVQIEDGRMIEATVPEKNVNEFYLRVPKPPSSSIINNSNQQQQPQQFYLNPDYVREQQQKKQNW